MQERAQAKRLRRDMQKRCAEDEKENDAGRSAERVTAWKKNCTKLNRCA